VCCALCLCTGGRAQLAPASSARGGQVRQLQQARPCAAHRSGRSAKDARVSEHVRYISAFGADDAALGVGSRTLMRACLCQAGVVLHAPCLDPHLQLMCHQVCLHGSLMHAVNKAHCHQQRSWPIASPLDRCNASTGLSALPVGAAKPAKQSLRLAGHLDLRPSARRLLGVNLDSCISADAHELSPVAPPPTPPGARAAQPEVHMHIYCALPQ